MKLLVGCEESQAVTIAFRALGHEAYSCDLLPCSGGHPEWHIEGDVLEVSKGYWDLTITFQPCTDLTVSGARWFEKKRLSGEQEKSIRFFFEVWKLSDCSENPIGILNGGKYVKKWFPALYQEMKYYGFPFEPSQIIQPWQFGHGETKATCLWLKNLPLLKPTNIVDGREQRIWKMPPGPERQKLRSKTYEGIAKAMAEQWGGQLLKMAV
jgi:hypothetical protein